MLTRKSRKEEFMIAPKNIVKIMKELPKEATILDAMEKLFLLYKIEKGIKQADSGRKISHEEAIKRMEKWLK